MTRVGFGYDSHVFAPPESGRPLVLGGVVFEGAPGLLGHSDADALCHAAIDALLGAAGLGDVGSHFPDTDPKWKGADSMRLLEAVVAEVRSAGWKIGNVDATVICERAKIRPKADAMRSRLASVLGVEADAVSVKGKTNEGMDAVGEGRALEVHCVALLER